MFPRGNPSRAGYSSISTSKQLIATFLKFLICASGPYSSLSDAPLNMSILRDRSRNYCPRSRKRCYGEPGLYLIDSSTGKLGAATSVSLAAGYREIIRRSSMHIRTLLPAVASLGIERAFARNRSREKKIRSFSRIGVTPCDPSQATDF